MTLRIVTYNIQFGTGRDGRVDLERICAEVRDADVIALQEVDRFWPRSGDVDQVAELVKRLPDYDWVYGPGVDLPVADTSGAGSRRRRQFGNLLLSRHGLGYAKNHLLPKRASLGPISVQRSALECLIPMGGLRVRVVNLHLTHLASETRVPQVEKLMEIHHNAVYEGNPVCGNLDDTYWSIEDHDQGVPREAIMLGDFNMTPDSPEYALLTGPTAYNGEQIINPETFADAWIIAGGDPDGGHTSDVNGIPARLDYGFVSPDLAGHIRSCRVDDTATGSDHYPVWIEFEEG